MVPQNESALINATLLRFKEDIYMFWYQSFNKVYLNCLSISRWTFKSHTYRRCDAFLNVCLIRNWRCVAKTVLTRFWHICSKYNTANINKSKLYTMKLVDKVLNSCFLLKFQKLFKKKLSSNTSWGLSFWKALFKQNYWLPR